MRNCLLILLLLANNSSIGIAVAETAVLLFKTIIDLFHISTQNNELEHLTKEVSDIKKLSEYALDALCEKLDKITYQNVLIRYIDKIDSCEKDYFYYVENPSPITENILKKCSNIIESVRPLGKYISGARIFDGPLLFDLYKDSDGVCDGSSMENIFKNLFADYVIGCTVATTIERIEHGENSNLYANECKATMSKIVDYLKSLYHSCATPCCKRFHCSVQHIFSKSPPTSPIDLYEKLSEIYPWFNFLIFQSSKGGLTSFGGNYFVRHDDNHWANKSTYDIFFFDGFTQLTKEEQNFSLAIRVSQRLLIDQYFGNSTLIVNFFDGIDLGTIIGYAPENNSMCNDKNTEDNRNCQTTGSTNILFAGTYLICCLFVFLIGLIG